MYPNPSLISLILFSLNTLFFFFLIALNFWGKKINSHSILTVQKNTNKSRMQKILKHPQSESPVLGCELDFKRMNLSEIHQLYLFEPTPADFWDVCVDRSVFHAE